MLSRLAPYILAIALFIFGLSLGFFAGRVLFKDGTLISQSEKPPTNNTHLFSTQTATIRGHILKRDGSNLTVKNLNNNQEGIIKASSRITIAKFNPSSRRAATPSSDLATLDFNKEVFISLDMVNGDYEAKLIQYVLPTPSLPPFNPSSN